MRKVELPVVTKGFDALTDVNIWTRLPVAEQDSVISKFSQAVRKHYAHVDTRAFSGNDSLRIPGFKHKASGILMNLVVGGMFQMGFSALQEESMLAIDSDISFPSVVLPPAHTVHVRPFLISRFPILRDFASRLVEIDDYLFRPEFSRNKNDPVPIYLTREEIDGISSQVGLSLPAEAQWEYAYRCGSETLFPWGNTLPSEEELNDLFLRNYSDPKRVARSANGFGLLGMHIGEWCRDSFFINLDNQPTNDLPSSEEPPHATRGGAAVLWPWQSSDEWALCMSAARWNSEGCEDGTCGARFVQTLDIEHDNVGYV